MAMAIYLQYSDHENQGIEVVSQVSVTVQSTEPS